jgi:hypothetical protein
LPVDIGDPVRTDLVARRGQEDWLNAKRAGAGTCA